MAFAVRMGVLMVMVVFMVMAVIVVTVIGWQSHGIVLVVLILFGNADSGSVATQGLVSPLLSSPDSLLVSVLSVLSVVVVLVSAGPDVL